jgi:large subunit ribosomal protein L17
MQHTQSKFHKKAGPRRSFMKSLMHNFIMKGSMATTTDRARATRMAVERLITLAKRQDVAHLRMLISRLPHRSSACKLFYEIAPRYADRKGGYTRIVKLGTARMRDGAPVARIEFV